MILPIGVSWLCTLLWGCICFPPQTGYNIAHGYSLGDYGFSSHAGVLVPQTSNQFNSGTSLKTNHDSISPGDEMQATSHQSFVSLQREPVHHENEDARSVTSLSEEEIVQSQPDSGHEPDEFSVVPSVQKYEPETSGNQHPFGLLVKEHASKKTMEGISFPTIKDFKRFIETMKSSFLTPGSDLSRHFQTAREIVENKVASNEPDTGYRSNSAKEGVDASENEVWSEPMNAAFEQSEQGHNYQMLSESLSVPDPVDSTASLISTSVYDNQDSDPGSALYPHPNLAGTEHVSSNSGGFDNGGISGKNTEFPEKIPSGSFFGGDFSFSGHVTASAVNAPNSPAQDFSHYSSKTSNLKPLNSENMTPANVLFAPTPTSLGSYRKSLYVNAPKGQHHIPDYVPKHRERPALSFQLYQPTVGKETKDINYTPSIHLPVPSSFSSSNNLSPQSSSGHVGVQTSSPHEAQNQALNRKQPVISHQVFTVKPSTSLHGSSRHEGYLGDKITAPRPSILTDQANDEEKSHLSEQNAIQEPKQMPDNSPILISGGLDSTQSGISSPVGVDFASFNSLSNLAPTSASESAFSRLVGNKVISRNFGIKNVISDRFPTGARNPLGSFITPQRGGISLNGGYGGATRAGLLQTLIQPTKIQKHPANVNKELGNVAYRSPKPLSASKVSSSALTGVFWRNGGNTKRFLPQTSLNMSPSAVNAYIMKSRSSYVRSKVSQSKTRYAPYQLDEGKAGKHKWKPALRQRTYKNNVSHNAKGFEEP